ncbi:hypothetical protein WJX73_008557 [Symbiochloris irregularis]|uniref:Uncharacterized protein n=1 Tax=Symbiochloris irregularis TaxID=706552 RepID=A0AAW1PQF9_9CHLO
MSAKVPPFAAIGQNAKEVLTGGKAGVYQYNRKLTATTRASDGVDFVTSLVFSGPGAPAEPSVKAIYKTGDTALSALFLPNGKISLSGIQSNITPGLALSAIGTYPEGDSVKFGADYNLPHVTVKATVEAASSPIVTANITTGRPDLFAGVDATFNSSNNEVTKWTVGAGYTAKEYQVGVLLLDKGQTIKGTYAHVLDASKGLTVAGEVNYDLNQGKKTTIIVGGQTRTSNGALIKARLDSESILSFHWEAEVPNYRTTVGVSVQTNASNLEAPPKLGFAASAAY